MACNPKHRRREWKDLAAWMRTQDTFRREAKNPRRHGLRFRYWPEKEPPRPRTDRTYWLSACYVLPTSADWSPSGRMEP